MSKNLEGIVVERKTKRRFSGATVQLKPIKDTEGEVIFYRSKIDGTFIFDIDTLEAGEYELLAYHPASRAKLYPLIFSISSDKKILIYNKEAALPLKLKLEPQHIVSNKAGVLFLLAILGLLSGLALFYINLHQKNKPLSPLIFNPIIEQLEDVKTAIEGTESPDFKEIKTTVVGVHERIKSIKDYGLIEKERTKYIEFMFSDIIKIMNTADIDSQKVLNQLEYINTLIRQQIAYFWQESPLRYLEILFWAVAATLIRLAMNAGRYIYWGNFYADAIPKHIGYLIAVPIMAVLIAFVLSFVKIDLNLGESGINLDLSNVTASIVVAALVGLTPWQASDFLGGLADLFFKKLSSMFGISENGDEATEQLEIAAETAAPEQEPSQKRPPPEEGAEPEETQETTDEDDSTTEKQGKK
jgi:hypothetical protein